MAVTAATERNRVVPVINAVRDALPGIAVSIDTYRAETAEAALDAGADMVNDVWGLRADPDLGPLAASRRAPRLDGWRRRRARHARWLNYDNSILSGSIEARIDATLPSALIRTQRLHFYAA